MRSENPEAVSNFDTAALSDWGNEGGFIPPDEPTTDEPTSTAGLPATTPDLTGPTGRALSIAPNEQPETQ
jgi:hypothetical protein